MATGAPGLSNQNAGVVNAASKKSGKLNPAETPLSGASQANYAMRPEPLGISHSGGLNLADRPLSGGAQGGGVRTAFDEYSARIPGAPQPGEFGIDARQYGSGGSRFAIRPEALGGSGSGGLNLADRPLSGGGKRGEFGLSPMRLGEPKLSAPDLGLRNTALKMQLGIRPSERELRRYAQRQHAEGAGSGGLAGLFSLSASPRAQMARSSAEAGVLGGLAGKYGDSGYGQAIGRAGAYEDLNLRRFRAEEAATDAAYAPARNVAQIRAQELLAKQRELRAQKDALDWQSAVNDLNAGVPNAKREKTLADAKKAQVEAERAAAEWSRVRAAQDAQRMAFDARSGNGSSNLSPEQIRAIAEISPEIANRLWQEQYPTVGGAQTGSGQWYSVVNDGNRSFIVPQRNPVDVVKIAGGILNEYTGEAIPDYLPKGTGDADRKLNPDAALFRFYKTNGLLDKYGSENALDRAVKAGEIPPDAAANIRRFRGWDGGVENFKEAFRKTKTKS